MDYTRLRQELLSDPAGLGYGALSDTAAADRLNATDTGRTRPRTQVPAREVLGAIDNGAWPSTAANQDKLRAILAIDPIDASNANLVGILSALFPNSGATQATRGRLLALQTEVVSRADELGLGQVWPEDVRVARSGVW